MSKSKMKTTEKYSNLDGVLDAVRSAAEYLVPVDDADKSLEANFRRAAQWMMDWSNHLKRDGSDDASKLCAELADANMDAARSLAAPHAEDDAWYERAYALQVNAGYCVIDAMDDVPIGDLVRRALSFARDRMLARDGS